MDKNHVMEEALFHKRLLTVFTFGFVILVDKAWLFVLVGKPPTPSHVAPRAHGCNVITSIDPLFAEQSENSDLIKLAVQGRGVQLTINQLGSQSTQ